jgi:hypothetical protein
VLFVDRAYKFLFADESDAIKPWRR